MMPSRSVQPKHLLLFICLRLRHWLGALLVLVICTAFLLSTKSNNQQRPLSPQHPMRHDLDLPATPPPRRPSLQWPKFIIDNNLDKVPDDAILSENDEEQGIVECDDECDAFRLHLNKRPPSQPSGAVYYLTQKSRLSMLKKSLQFLDENLNDQFQYPVIIFHERDLFSMRKEIRTFTRSAIFFQEISLELPTFLAKGVKYNIPCMSPINYRKMCRFHAKGVYESPIIQNVDFLLRLDDDSFITSKLRYDLFDFMRLQDLRYGYIWEHYDATSCTEGLWEASQHFINVTKIKPTFFHQWPRPKLYYNNFELSHSSIWLSPVYRAYVNYLDQLGGIFYHRWGDAPIKGIAVSMFVQKNQTHLFSDIGYKHNTFTN